MANEFCHLHTHSEFSLLDGLGRLGDLVEAAAEQGMTSLALTDHGAMHGSVDFYSKARERGVKPIIGCEIYVADRPLEERPGPDARNYHLVLLAENAAGYKNLIRLTTEAHLSGFYRKPRVDHALLERHAEGLICLSGCASSELSRTILDGDESAASQLADWYRQVFPGRFYLELQDHQLDLQRPINEGLLRLKQALDLPLVATNDVHYVQRRQALTHEILLCVQTQTTMDDPKRMRMSSEEFYLKSPAEMAALFGDHPEALANTLAIAERCNLELTFGRPQLPRFQTPSGESSECYLRHLCQEGIRRRYGQPSAEAQARLQYELSVILSTGYVDYFLLVYDVIHFARSRGIAVGPGRGSAAGSLVAYCLFLTNIDPIVHGLSFERFLNPERVTMPDMDLDFADDRRDEVIRYVTEKYGRDRVAQIITFGTVGPRLGVRDVGRVMGMPYGDIDRVAKLIPAACHELSKAKGEVAELQQLCEEDEAIRTLLDTVEDMEGVARHASTHAAGVVISRDPLAEHVPLYKVPKNDQVVTQYAMSAIEKIGLLKMDFLGLRTLTILERAVDFIERATGDHLSLDDIDLEHPSIYQTLSSGETFGIFQVDGQGMRKFLRQLRPREFKHLVALNAMYRPGPIEFIGEFAARLNGEKAVTYDHPALEEVLEETYGIVVYQEQVMKLANVVAGYSMGEGDLLRRAMAKKKPEELAKHRETFISRAEERGTDRATAEHLFEIIEPFSGYAFNKAHSAAYSVITAQTAYLKAQYPREYMAGLLSAERENIDKIAEAMGECHRLGIAVLPPDVNRSELDFTLEDEGIRFGLGAIKHAGTAAIEAILQARESGPFQSLEDFCGRVDWTCVNKRVIESLARCGAFDSFHLDRARLVENLDRIVSFGSQLYRDAMSAQASLFGESEAPAPVLQLTLCDPATLEDRIAWEQELLGIAVSRHPVRDAEDQFHQVQALTVSEADERTGKVRVGGLIRSLRSFSTRDGRPMASLQLTDLQSVLEVVVFSRSMESCQERLVEGRIVVVDGKIDASDGGGRLLAEAIHTLEEAANRPAASNGNGKPSAKNSCTTAGPPEIPAGPARRLTLTMRRTQDREGDLARLERVYCLLQRQRGVDEVDLVIVHGPRRFTVALPNRTTCLSAELERELRQLVPEVEIAIETPGMARSG